MKGVDFSMENNMALTDAIFSPIVHYNSIKLPIEITLTPGLGLECVHSGPALTVVAQRYRSVSLVNARETATGQITSMPYIHSYPPVDPCRLLP
jgi:hypothetical protein